MALCIQQVIQKRHVPTPDARVCPLAFTTQSSCARRNTSRQWKRAPAKRPHTCAAPCLVPPIQLAHEKLGLRTGQKSRRRLSREIVRNPTASGHHLLPDREYPQHRPGQCCFLVVLGLLLGQFAGVSVRPRLPVMLRPTHRGRCQAGSA